MALWISPIKLDGGFGPFTQECFQRVLRDMGQYKYAIDGNFGPRSVRALQTALRAPGYYFGAIDGVAGNQTWNAWWDYLKGWGYWDGGRVTDSGKIPQNIGYGLTIMTQKALNNYRVRYEFRP